MDSTTSLNPQQLQVLHQGHTGEVSVKEDLGTGPVQHHNHVHEDSIAKAVLHSPLVLASVNLKVYSVASLILTEGPKLHSPFDQLHGKVLAEGQVALELQHANLKHR